MKKFKVIKYSHIGSYHECLDEDGKSHNIDIIVNGDFRKQIELDANFVNTIVGSTITIDYTYPYIEIGMGVRLLI